MRNLNVTPKFASKRPLPCPHSSIFSIGENGSLFQVIRPNASMLADNCTCTESSSFLNRIYKSNLDELVKGGLDDVFQAQFISSNGCLYMGTSRGQFLRYYLHIGEVEEIFDSVSGTIVFSVSPDACFVVIITYSGSIILLSLTTLEVISEHQIFDPLKCDIGQGISSRISWRHDSQYFVVNVPNEVTGRRLMVYDEHGTLFSTSDESTILVSDVLAWVPSGGLVAAIEKAPVGKDGVLVSFFELNMLKRSSFGLVEGPFVGVDSTDVQSLSWNLMSDVLVVARSSTVELWHRSNYLWMRKHTIRRHNLPENHYKIKFVEWDRENTHSLHIVFDNGYYCIYDCILAYPPANTLASGLSVSINGCNLYCTPFALTSAPPPYGFFQLSMECYVQEVVTSNFWDGFLCILLDGRIVPVKYTEAELVVLNPISLNMDKMLPYNWTWPNSGTLCCLNEETILIYDVPTQLPLFESDVQVTLTLKLVIPVTCSFMTVTTQPNSLESSHLLIRKDDDICLLNLEDIQRNPAPLFKTHPGYFHDFKYIYTGSTEATRNEYPRRDTLIVIAHDILTRRLEIFYDNKCYKWATDCTSTATFDDYLLYTTIQGTLQIIHVSQLKKALLTQATTLTPQIDQYSRKIEKGSVILRCCSNRLLEPTIVFQVLPRGNLETIHPRPLVIASIRMLLRNTNKRSFNAILGVMRRHRIDANVLVDELKVVEKDGSFGLTMVDAITAIVQEVVDPNLLVLFVTEINTGNLDFVSLLKTILEKHTIDTVSIKKVIQPYLATMARLGLYEEILNSNLILGESDREVVKKRIQFLSFYADKLDTLYEAALGTYDLNLTAIVADCLNKDPKEYLPILNNLRSLSDLKRRYTINSTLKKWEKGLRDLLEDASVQAEEISRYVQKHQLHSDAINLISPDSTFQAHNRNLDEITVIRSGIQNGYGEYLESRGKDREASILYHRGGNLPKAIECAVRAGCWEFALTVDGTKENYDKLCNKLLQSFEQKQEWRNAARLCEIYLADYPLAVKFWLNAHQWRHAYSLTVKSSNFNNIIVELLEPKLKEYSVVLVEFLTTLVHEFKHHSIRYAAIKLKQEAAKNGEGFTEHFSDTESISTTSSVRTSTRSEQTARTYRSGKNKRKLDRKIHSLKEGSRYEDKAIIIRVWDAATSVQLETKPDVSETIEYLWRLQFDDKAIRLTLLFEEVVAEINSVIQTIWAIPPVDEEKILDRIILHKKMKKSTKFVSHVKLSHADKNEAGVKRIFNVSEFEF